MLQTIIALVVVGFVVGAAPALPAAKAAQNPAPRMVSIPAGAFWMGSEQGDGWEKPEHLVELPAYSISPRPVTLGEFRAYRPTHDNHPASAADLNSPVTAVTYDDAVSYARWLGERTGQQFRLPTEAEWERAIRGGLEKKLYPWGDQAPANDAGERANAFGVIPAPAYWEWVADYYSADYYAKSPAVSPKGPESGDFRVLRGGGFPGGPGSATTFQRGSARPATSSQQVTFRVVLAGIGPAVAPTVTRAPAPTRTQVPVVAQQDPMAAAMSGVLSTVHISSSGDGLTVTLPVGPGVKPTTMTLAEPARLVVDLPGVEVRTSRSMADVGRAGVKRIRWAQFKAQPAVARVVFDLDLEVAPAIESTASGVVIRFP